MKSAIIVAGGTSSRFEQNKLFAPLFDKTLIQTTVDSFVDVADEIILVVKSFPFYNADRRSRHSSLLTPHS